MSSETACKTSWDVIVIGAGAAGLFAATTASARGRETLILEKNSKLGVKILMSGGTRCNITHDVDWQGIAEAYGKVQGRFLKFSLASLTPDMIVDFFSRQGVETKTESTGKIFPRSDKAIDVRNALVNAAINSGAAISNPSSVASIEKTEQGFRVLCDQTVYTAESVILTSGGQSYPGCGTTGDGYQMLMEMGHTIVSPRPALVPIRVSDDWVHQLSGVTLPDVALSVIGKENKSPQNDRVLNRGSFLFTHFGVSGPIAMNVSRTITDPANSFAKFLSCDWVPQMSVEEFENNLLRGKETSGNQSVLNWLNEAVSQGNLSRRVVESLCGVAGCESQLRLAEISKLQMRDLITVLKRCELSVTGTLGFKKAEVTAGGVALDEINSKTMESKIVPGLFVAGELLDVDGPIGGYNFQAAFSTGNTAGLNA